MRRFFGDAGVGDIHGPLAGAEGIDLEHGAGDEEKENGIEKVCDSCRAEKTSINFRR